MLLHLFPPQSYWAAAMFVPVEVPGWLFRRFAEIVSVSDPDRGCRQCPGFFSGFDQCVFYEFYLPLGHGMTGGPVFLSITPGIHLCSLLL